MYLTKKKCMNTMLLMIKQNLQKNPQATAIVSFVIGLSLCLSSSLWTCNIFHMCIPCSKTFNVGS